MPVAYDFPAGDNLVSVLRQASQKLQAFMSQRSKLAQSDLTYRETKGNPCGWIGTVYDDWARQFNQSQNVLNGYVAMLDQHAVNVNNDLYETELRIYKRTSRTQLPAPAPPQSPPRAPDNSAKDGTEGAVPTCLYDYSDKTTASNDQIRPFFSATVPGAASAAPTDGTTAGLPTVSDLGQSIARFLRLSVLELDARVRIVGQEFETAGGGNSQRFYTYSSPQALKLALQRSGANAAQQLKNLRANGGPDMPPSKYAALLKEMEENQDDPAWTTAFFNNLSQEDIEALLRLRDEKGPDMAALSALAQSYVTALGSGQLKSSAASTLVNLFLNESPNAGDISDFDQLLLNDLQSNPDAAYQFLNSASNAQLTQMLNGNYITIGQSNSDREAQIINIATVALQGAKDQNNLPGFYQRISGLIMKTQPSDAEKVLPAAQNFFGTYIALDTTPPMPGAGPDALTSWASQVSGNLNANLDTWLSWIDKFDKQNLDGQATRQAWEAFVIGLLVTGLGLLVAPVVGFGIGVGATILTGWPGPPLSESPLQWVDSQVFPITGNVVIDNESMGNSAEAATEYTVIANAIAEGNIIGPDGNPLTLSEGNVQAVLDNPTLYPLRGSDDKTADVLVNAVDAKFSYKYTHITTDG